MRVSPRSRRPNSMSAMSVDILRCMQALLLVRLPFRHPRINLVRGSGFEPEVWVSPCVYVRQSALKMNQPVMSVGS